MPSTPFVRLTGSVGRDGGNAVLDVMAIQHLINVYPPHGLLPLAIDGRCGLHTIAAIEAVERLHLLMASPDGRIDPSGPTLRALNMARKMGGAQGDKAPAPPARPASGIAAPLVTKMASKADSSAGTSHRHRIPSREVIVAAQKSQQRWGVRASISIGQWILESGWGKATPRGSNNPFGIKAAPGQPFVMAPHARGDSWEIGLHRRAISRLCLDQRSLRRTWPTTRHAPGVRACTRPSD